MDGLVSTEAGALLRIGNPLHGSGVKAFNSLIYIIDLHRTLITQFQGCILPQGTAVTQVEIELLIDVKSHVVILPLWIRGKIIVGRPHIVFSFLIPLVFKIEPQQVLFIPVEGMFVVGGQPDARFSLLPIQDTAELFGQNLVVVPVLIPGGITPVGLPVVIGSGNPGSIFFSDDPVEP